mmetsp:Transcript_13694/g.36941  ORF Transcript_13694/g.36941 Transcript_13694/m.36941 type:complete len:228 (+) Transcript_13694:494-1177(+)
MKPPSTSWWARWTRPRDLGSHFPEPSPPPWPRWFQPPTFVAPSLPSWPCWLRPPPSVAPRGASPARGKPRQKDGEDVPAQRLSARRSARDLGRALKTALSCRPPPAFRLWPRLGPRQEPRAPLADPPPLASGMPGSPYALGLEPLPPLAVPPPAFGPPGTPGSRRSRCQWPGRSLSLRRTAPPPGAARHSPPPQLPPRSHRRRWTALGRQAPAQQLRRRRRGFHRQA